jgi:hypothetical protein
VGFFLSICLAAMLHVGDFDPVAVIVEPNAVVAEA